MECPYCGSTNVHWDEVDNGVGMQQCGPAGCDDCHSFQIQGDAENYTEEERKVGWSKGEFLTKVLQRNAALDRHFGGRDKDRPDVGQHLDTPVPDPVL